MLVILEKKCLKEIAQLRDLGGVGADRVRDRHLLRGRLLQHRLDRGLHLVPDCDELAVVVQEILAPLLVIQVVPKRVERLEHCQLLLVARRLLIGFALLDHVRQRRAHGVEDGELGALIFWDELKRSRLGVRLRLLLAQIFELLPLLHQLLLARHERGRVDRSPRLVLLVCPVR